MIVKSLDRRTEKDLKLKSAKMLKLKKNGIDYYIFGAIIEKIKKPLTINLNDKNVVMLDQEYSFVQILPISQNFVLTIIYDKNKTAIMWKVDITLSNFLDEIGMPFFEDTGLGLVLTKENNIFIVGSDDLEKELSDNDITKESYNFVIKKAELIRLNMLENIDNLKKISRKYLKIFDSENRLVKESKENTYRVNIKPGIKVAIVLKKDQKSGVLTEGIVKDILTNSAVHHRGIKVRLTNGSAGRVQKIL